jgi:general secretion pathway protein G
MNRRAWIAVSALALVLAPTIAIIPSRARISRTRTALRAENAKVIRDASETYTIDEGHAPDSLNDLVKSGYLKSIPKDPK